MKRTRNCLILIVLLLIIIAFESFCLIRVKSVISKKDVLIAYNFKGNCIPDRGSAIKYAKIIYKTRTGNDYSEELFDATYLDELNAWHVYLIEDGVDRLDSYGIFIDKDYGTIFRDYIQ